MDLRLALLSPHLGLAALSINPLLVANIGISGCSDSKESACSLGDWGLIPGSGRSPGEGNGYLLQYSTLENSMDTGTWQVTIHGVTKS